MKLKRKQIYQKKCQSLRQFEEIFVKYNFGPKFHTFFLPNTLLVNCTLADHSSLWAEPLRPKSCGSIRSELQHLQTFMGINADWEKND